MEISKLNQDEIDLSLELSIGGIFRKFEKSKAQQKSISSSITFEAESCGINDTDLRRENESFLCKFSSGGLGEVDALDLKQKTKREIQALRRQEARKKREEKRKRRRNFILKNENEGSERFCKKIKPDYGNQTIDVTNLPAFGSYPPCSIIPAQFVPFGNRFVFPYHMTSYWAECDLEKNGLKVQSSKSIGSGLSSVSHHDNGRSSDTITSLPQYSTINNTQCKSELTVSSESTKGVVAADEANSDTVKVVSSNNQSSRPRQADDDEEPNCVSNPHDPINKTISITKNPFPLPPTSTTQSRRSMVEHNTNAYQTQYLTQMPCVSTTGNGPRGKTINGFLYRCTKREVSIMCVCHGSSFTPAEFVKHAGGNNMYISHPMKHIFVLPSIPIS